MRFFGPAEFPAILLSLILSYQLNAADTQGAVCSADPSSALIFVGALTELTATSSPSGWNLGTYHVTELLQGEASGAVSILMWNELCHDSGTTPAVGKTYLVRTHVLPKGSANSVYQLEACEQLRPLEQATAELEYLRASQRGSTPTEVSGDAIVEPRGYPGKKVPLPKTKIHLVGTNQRFDFVSDEDGAFHGALTPGTYAVNVEFPTGYSADYSNHHAVTATEHRCAQLTLPAYPTASITAHIVDIDGNPLSPLSNMQLTLETAGDQQFVQSVWPNEKSDLEAENLLPGQYILGLNTYLPVNPGSEPYPPIYFPGVSTRSGAEVITLSAGEHKVLSEMRIKKGQACEIPVLVIDSSGKPSPSTVVALAYRDYAHFYIEPRQQTDENGREMVYAVFPGPVLLRAEKQRKDGSTVESESLEVSSCPAEAVSLKLSRIVANQSELQKK